VLNDDLPAALSRPDFYPHRPQRVLVHQTHISWVFLAGERAYKLKKPLALPFLDYHTPARRRKMCKEEVRLNRRLASEIYLRVRSIIATPRGLALAEEEDPRAVDYLVEMRRFDERETLAMSLRRGEVGSAQIATVAKAIAAFHQAARHVKPEGVPSTQVRRRLSENLDELQGLLHQHAERQRVLALQRFISAFMLSHTSMFDARALQGFVRDGHGDLRAEHVLLREQIQIVDCIEFDPHLREIDIAEDIAFLVMDLASLGSERYGQMLLSCYRAAGIDPGEDRLIALYALSKALVRMKIEHLAADQHAPGSAAHGHHSAAARELLALAERLAWRARLPLAIVICGLPAAGKSQLASALCAASGLAHLSSDLTRKRLAGIDPHRRGMPHLYSGDFSKLTYAELGARAAGEVRSRNGVIVDATFRSRADRDAFRQAFTKQAPLLFVECTAPLEVLARRAASREQAQHVSDASPTVVLAQADSWQPLDEIPSDAHIVLRSDRPTSKLIEDLLSLLDQRLSLAHASPHIDAENC
jgi:uncharacterized protein